VALGAQRQDLHDQEWGLDRLSSGLVALAGRSDIGFEIGVRADHSGFDLCVARTPPGQRRVDARYQTHHQHAMCFGRRRHRHREAADQFVVRLGAVIPAQEVRQGHRFDR
jgi:hypothetical protein